MLKPNTYNVTGCDHEDITFTDLKGYQQDVSMRYHTNLCRLLGANNPTQFKDSRLDTGLCKQTILSGLRCGLGIPGIFLLDIMHLINLNNPDLLLGLYDDCASSSPLSYSVPIPINPNTHFSAYDVLNPCMNFMF
jgi:hypothetical protein